MIVCEKCEKMDKIDNIMIFGNGREGIISSYCRRCKKWESTTIMEGK